MTKDKPLPREITENGIHYTLHGDYYFPDFPEAKAKPRTHGKWGRARLNYLKNHPYMYKLHFRPYHIKHLSLHRSLLTYCYKQSQPCCTHPAHMRS